MGSFRQRGCLFHIRFFQVREHGVPITRYRFSYEYCSRRLQTVLQTFSGRTARFLLSVYRNHPARRLRTSCYGYPALVCSRGAESSGRSPSRIASIIFNTPAGTLLRSLSASSATRYDLMKLDMITGRLSMSVIAH